MRTCEHDNINAKSIRPRTREEPCWTPNEIITVTQKLKLPTFTDLNHLHKYDSDHLGPVRERPKVSSSLRSRVLRSIVSKAADKSRGV